MPKVNDDFDENKVYFREEPVELEQFSRIVQAITAEMTRDDFVKFHRKIALSLLTRILLRTPVDTGRARGNWQTTINDVPTDIVDGFWTNTKKVPGVSSNSEQNGARATGEAIKQALQSLGKLKEYVVVNLTNNVDYINKLEFGEFDPPDPGPSKDPRPDRTGKILVSGGFSTQAPEGMVRASILEEQLGFKDAYAATQKGPVTK